MHKYRYRRAWTGRISSSNGSMIARAEACQMGSGKRGKANRDPIAVANALRLWNQASNDMTGSNIFGHGVLELDINNLRLCKISDGRTGSLRKSESCKKSSAYQALVKFVLYRVLVATWSFGCFYASASIFVRSDT